MTFFIFSSFFLFFCFPLHPSKSEGRDDAVLGVNESCRGPVDAIDIGINFGTLREPAFDSGPGFGVGFPRSVANGFLELPVLPLLPVPQNPGLPIDSAELSCLGGGRAD